MKTYGWSQSATFRDIGRQSMRAWNARRHLLPKCGAKAKHSGEPCEQVAMGNGRCYYHGGNTPKGAGWHKPKWPDRNSPDVEAKLNRKLRDRERAAEKRVRRLAAMTPEERAAHAEWQRTHKPGPAKARAAARARRRADREAHAAFARIDEPHPRSEELLVLEKRADELRAELVTLRAISKEDIFG